MKTKNVVYHVARTRDELEQAFSLVYKEYAQRGYIPKHYKSKLKISIFNALPSTTTFVAKQGNKVVATVSLVSDSPMGILMDKLYKKEVDKLRRQGRRVAEVSGLAVATELFGRSFFTMFNFNKLIFVFKLFRTLLDYALCIEKLNDFCIAFNPKHQYLYKFLQFEKLGKLKYYGAFHSPAIAMRLNIDTAEEIASKRRGVYKIFFGKKMSNLAFKNKYKLTPKDLEYFFINNSDIFKKATKEQLAYMKSCYPKKQIETILKKIRY